MNSITRIDIPLFTPQYNSDSSYGWSNLNGDRLLELLYKTTNGYCMYCYSRIYVDSKKIGHLEHAIEKRHCEKLKECVPNIGLACPICNMSFKKIGDSSKMFTNNQIMKFESAICKKDKCIEECSAYKLIKRNYLKKRKIILQPMGISKKKHTYKIQYNLLTLSFEPSDKVPYTIEEKEFINNHISRFNLNDSVFRTKELLKFCEDIINGNVYLRKGKYNNYIVDLFIDKLENLDEQEVVKLCSNIYKIGKHKRII